MAWFMNECVFCLVAAMCRDIPGFTNLHRDTQAVLMEAAYFDIWMVSTELAFTCTYQPDRLLA